MMEFLSASENHRCVELDKQIVTCPLSEARSGHSSSVASLICSSIDFAKGRDLDSETTVSFVKQIVEIYFHAQIAIDGC